MSEFYSVSLSTPCRALCTALDKKEPFFPFVANHVNKTHFHIKRLCIRLAFITSPSPAATPP